MFTNLAVFHPANAAITLARIVNNSPLQPLGGPCLSPTATDRPLRPVKNYLAWPALNKANYHPNFIETLSKSDIHLSLYLVLLNFIYPSLLGKLFRPLRPFTVFIKYTRFACVLRHRQSRSLRAIIKLLNQLIIHSAYLI